MSPFKPPSARSASSTPFDLVVRFAVATGLRPSEICGLRVGRLNLVKGTVEVAEALTVISGRTEVGPTKSYARRTVGLPPWICDDLGEFLTRRAQERQCPPSPDDYVFTAPRGGPLRRDLLLKRFTTFLMTPSGMRTKAATPRCVGPETVVFASAA
jgi:integrase